MSEFSASLDDYGPEVRTVQCPSREPLSCAVKPRVPSGGGDSMNKLKHILDSVPFTPSQGGNPFFDDDSSPSAMYYTNYVPKEPSWASSSLSQRDMPARSSPHLSPLSHNPCKEPARYGHSMQTPRSQSQASTTSSSPHTAAQLDMCSVMGYAQHEWHGSANEQSNMLPVGQPFHPSEDYRTPAYQMSISHGMHGMPMSQAFMYARTQHQGFTHVPRHWPGQSPVHVMHEVHQPSSSRSESIKERSQHSSPQRSQGACSKKESHHRQQNCYSNLQRFSVNSTGDTNQEADIGQHGPVHHKTDSDAISSLSTDSPTPGSPSQHPKAKIDVKVSTEGNLVFNARQRRTLRRAMQRQRKIEIPDGREFTPGAPLSADERRIVADVIQLHVGCTLPDNTDVDGLVNVLLSLGIEGDASIQSSGA